MSIIIYSLIFQLNFFNVFYDAQSNHNAQFFIISVSYITFTIVSMNLLNGAQATNIFWFANNGAITFTSSDTTIYGSFITQAAFSSTSSPLIYGNIFSQT